MRVAAIGLLLVVLFGALGFWWLRSGDGVRPDGGSPRVAVANGQSSGQPSGQLGDGLSAVAAGLPDGVVATRALVEPIAAQGLAPAPTACLRVVDHDTGEPVVAAIVRQVHNGADVAFTDELGLAPVALANVEQLAVVHDGYLLRLAPTQLGSTEQQPQEVRLLRDTRSIRRRFVFAVAADAAGDGQELGELFARLRPVGALGSMPEIDRADAVLRRAWQEHTMLAAREVAHDVPVQLGQFDERRVLQLTAEAEVLFLAPGDYELSVATTCSLVGRVTVHVVAGPLPPPLRVELRPGAALRGRVTDATGTPLAKAELTMQGGEPLGLLATTRADGGFVLAPLLPGEVTLLARCAGHAPRAFGPVIAGPAAATTSAMFTIALDRLQQTLLRGRVRARPGLQAIAGATVLWQPTSKDTSHTTSTADGTFVLPVAGDLASRLMVQADGFVTYAELVQPNEGFADYDLWPADRATRLQQGLTGALEGIVLGDDGPVANASVRWQPAQPTRPAVVPGRRTLEGAALSLPLVATTTDDGAFVLETNQFGPGRLMLVGDDSKTIDLTVIAGETRTGLELRR